MNLTATFKILITDTIGHLCLQVLGSYQGVLVTKYLKEVIARRARSGGCRGH